MHLWQQTFPIYIVYSVRFIREICSFESWALNSEIFVKESDGFGGFLSIFGAKSRDLCWKRWHVPHDWLTSQVESIFKKRKQNDFSVYDGICLVDIAYKIYAWIMNQRLQTISEYLIIEERNGFRKSRSYTNLYYYY